MKIKKILCLLTSAALITAALSGCKEKETSGKTDNTTAKDEIINLTFLTAGDTAAKPISESDRIVAELNKRLGIKLTVKAVPEGSWDKINVIMASGDLPDVVVGQYPSAAVSQWISDDLLTPLNDYLNVMPTVKKQLEERLSWTAIDGKYYGYTFIEEKSNTTLAFRQDYLDKYGIKAPNTMDELYQAMKTIASQDPDGNGKNDTYGISGEKPIGAFDFVFYAYGLPYGDYALDKNNNVVPKFETDAFKDGMKYIKKLWDEKLIEPEFMLNDRGMHEQKIAQGKVAFFAVPLFRHVSRLEGLIKQVAADGKLGFSAPPAGPTGKRGLATTPKGGMITSITKAAKDPKKAARFIEFLLSQEGRDLLQLGIENVHYTKQGDKITYNETERAKENFATNGWAHPLAWGHVVWPLTLNYLPQTEPQRERAIQSVEIATKNKVPNLIPVTPASQVDLGSVLNDIYYQYFMDMLRGKIGIDEGVAELSKKWRQQGGDKVLSEANDLYKKLKK